jgi:hypothetical protein
MKKAASTAFAHVVTPAPWGSKASSTALSLRSTNANEAGCARRQADWVFAVGTRLKNAKRASGSVGEGLRFPRLSLIMRGGKPSNKSVIDMTLGERVLDAIAGTCTDQRWAALVFQH